jgi:MerR family transcriptional regulator/heat shock protein HspR
MSEQDRTEQARRTQIPLGRVTPQHERGSSLPERTAGGPGSEESIEQERAGAQEGVYIISVAARILRMHPQTLRKYERVGLVRPSRTMGMLRLYSEEDITKLRMIKHLVEEIRLNLAGVELAIAMVERLMAFRQRLTPRRTTQLDALQREVEDLLDLFRGR